MSNRQNKNFFLFSVLFFLLFHCVYFVNLLDMEGEKNHDYFINKVGFFPSAEREKRFESC